jgi:hypothetical protein
MASLVWQTARITKTIANHASDFTGVCQVEAPTNTPIKVKFHIYPRGTAGNTPVVFLVARDIDASGATLSSALAACKHDKLRSETPQATVKTFSVQPTDVSETNGDPRDTFVVQPTQPVFSPTYQLAGGERLALFGITATNACPVDVVPVIEE